MMRSPFATTPTRHAAAMALAFFGLVAIAGCAAQPTHKSHTRANPCRERNDPAPNSYLDDWDRANFGIDLPLFEHVYKPVGKSYRAITPRFIRHRISNFFSNMDEPAFIANDLLQGRERVAAHTTGRFLVNSTLGLLGTFDVAGKLGIHSQAIPEDFGLTLAHWGIGEGPYLVLPLLGPTTTRNALSPAVDGVLFQPTTYVPDHYRALNIIRGLGLLNTASENLQNIERMTGALDPYVFTRSAYLQHRRFLVRQNSSNSESQTNINCYLRP